MKPFDSSTILVRNNFLVLVGKLTDCINDDVGTEEKKA